MEQEELILVCVGVFADGKATPCYQLARYDETDSAYHLDKCGPNDPRALKEARQRLAERRSGDEGW